MNGRTSASVAGDLVAYALGGHRHYPEIVGGLAALAATPTVTFVPHLMPVARGIVETIYVRAARLPTAVALRALYDEAYAGERFVSVAGAPPELKDVVGTNGCRIFATVDAPARRVILVAAIDNLMKGAAGQAVQNLNLMAGFPEDWGLS